MTGRSPALGGGSGGGRVPEHVEHVGAAPDRQRSRAVGQVGQQAGHAQDAAAVVLRPERHAAELLALDAVDAVVLGQAFVDDGEVAVEQVEHRQVRPQQFVEELVRLAQAGVAQGVVVVLVLAGIDHDRVEFADPHPLADEVLDELPGPWDRQASA